ncbi:MAG: acyl carrier protein [Polyangiaceae bacterium]
MSETQDLFPLFREIAEEIEKRKLPNVTPNSVIAELGIDSLAMMQIVGELEARLGVMIPDDQLVKLVTVADLLRVVQSRAGQ